MASNPMDKVVRDIADLKRQLAGRSQLNHSSLENTAIPVNDEDGTERLRIGAQDDGTHAIKYVQGPPPPRPTAPSVSVDGPVVRVRWDGILMGGHIPEDFSRIDVHFALASEDLEADEAVRGNLATSAGNETVLAATQTGTYRVGLVAMSQSRARSEMSEVTEVEVELVNLKGAIDTAVDNASGGSNHYRPEPPEGTDHGENDLWFDTSVDADGLTHYTPHRWDETAQKWISLEDERIAAISAAQDDFTADLEEVRESVDGKTTIRWSPNVPTVATPGAVEGDTWFQYGSNRQLGHWRWNGSTWVKQDFDPVMIPRLDIGTGTFGDLDGIRLKASTVTAEKLLIGGPINLIPGVVPGTNRGLSALEVDENEDALRATGRQTLYADESITLPPGKYTVEADMKSSVWTRTYIGVLGVNTGVLYRYGINNVIVENEWAHYSATLTINEGEGGTYRVRLLPGYSGAIGDGHTWYRNISLRPMVGSTLIEPGSINTPHLLAGAVTAESGIIASIDLGVATVGYLNGARVEAGTIDTPQLAFGAATGDVLSVDALNFKTAVGLDIRGSSFRAGDAVEMTEDFGIRQFGPDGALNVSLPSDGSPAEFRGDLSARTLTATGRMSIQGPGAIASGGVLELESGVVPPVAGPQITNTWDRTTFPPLTDQETPAGLAWADGHFWRAVMTGVSLSEGGRVRIEKISPTGELVGGWDTSFRVNVDGITILNGELYVLAARLSVSGDDSTPIRPRMVVVYNLQGVEQRRWEYPHYGTGTYQPGIGNDGTNIVIAQSWANGNHTYRTYNPTTGVLVRQYDTGFQMRSNVTQILFGDFDYGDGRKKIIAQQRTDLKAFVCYNEAATSPDDVPRSWNAADFQNPVGLVWDGARFHSLTPTGDLVSYQSHETNRIIGDDADDWWGAVTWATGSQETTAGPATRFRYLHRAQLRVQNGDVPEGVEAARFYTSKGTSEPDRTELYLRAQSIQPHEPWKISHLLTLDTPTNPPATNTFAADTPGEIHSALGNFRVDGSGAGEWGPLTFHEDGTMTGLPAVAAGRVSVPAADGTAGNPVTVTFPAGRFRSSPAVTLTADSGSPSSITALTIRDVTATSADIRLLRTGSYDTIVHWIAFERTD